MFREFRQLIISDTDDGLPEIHPDGFGGSVAGMRPSNHHLSVPTAVEFIR